MVQVVEETADLGLFEKTGGSECHSFLRLFSGCEVRGFSNREGREYMNRCGHGWSL